MTALEINEILANHLGVTITEKTDTFIYGYIKREGLLNVTTPVDFTSGTLLLEALHRVTAPNLTYKEFTTELATQLAITISKGTNDE